MYSDQKSSPTKPCKIDSDVLCVDVETYPDVFQYERATNYN